jgi:hypothetical protein
MSLAVWLPFTENANTQGLEFTKFSAVDSGNAALATGGKIGICYSSSVGALVSETKINLGTQISMFAWVNPSSLSNMAVCGQLRGTSGTSNSGGTGACLSINGSGAIVATVGVNYAASGASMVSSGVWTHIGFTLHGKIVKFYKNGQEVSSATLGNTYTAISDFFGVFGGALTSGSPTTRSVNTANVFKGKLNDVRAFSHACSAKEVKEMAKGIVLHYKFDDDTILRSTIYDCSGYRNNGTVYGSLASDTDAGRYTRAINFTANPANYVSVNTAANIAPSLGSCTIAWWEKSANGKSLLITGGIDTAKYIAACEAAGTFYNGGVSGSPTYYKDGVKTAATSMKYTAGEWHHYAITGISMTAFTDMFINNYGGVTTWCVNGRLNDLRIYSTVLSDDDIKALAQVQAAVDSSGNVYAFEFKEV